MQALVSFADAYFTGRVGTFGTAALAGYGLGVRLELLQIPVVFAMGSALVVSPWLPMVWARWRRSNGEIGASAK